MKPPRKREALRRAGKLCYFMARGIPPRKAALLAAYDAPVAYNYAGVSSADLTAGCTAAQSWSEISVRGDVVACPASGLAYRADSFVAPAMARFSAAARAGCQFVDEGPAVLATAGPVRVRLTQAEEVEMFDEIFVRRVYDFRPPTASWLVFDVGANAGFASLQFAAESWVERVFAFEPFAPTAAAFQANLTLNPQFTPKIELHTVGLGEADAESMVPYCAELRGSMSVTGIGAWRSPGQAPAATIPIRVRSAATVLREVLARYPGRPVFGKFDCEGSEFPILLDLHRQRLLARLDALYLEVHGRSPAELLGALSANGFSCQVEGQITASTDICFLRAWRSVPAANGDASQIDRGSR